MTEYEKRRHQLMNQMKVLQERFDALEGEKVGAQIDDFADAQDFTEIKNLMKKFNYNCEDIAELSGIKAIRLRKIFSGELKIKDRDLNALAKVNLHFKNLINKIRAKYCPVKIEVLEPSEFICHTCGSSEIKTVDSHPGPKIIKGYAATLSKRTRQRVCMTCQDKFWTSELRVEKLEELAEKSARWDEVASLFEAAS